MCPFHPSRIGVEPLCRPHQRRSAQISGSIFAFSVPFVANAVSAFQPFRFRISLRLPGIASERSPVVQVVRRIGICVQLCLPCVAKAKQGKSVVKEVTGFYPQIGADFHRFFSA